MNTFNQFGLAAPILRALADVNHVTPTPIQCAAIPVVRNARDLIGIAQTGTGKTAAFALPILHHLFALPARPEMKSCRVLVLTPTRELAGQILETFGTYGRHMRLRTALAIGGVPIRRQIREVHSGTDVLIATPGRLLDLVRSHALRLDRVEVLVLDEADRMLDMGFIADIRQIVAKVPHARQTLLFSATMPAEITKLAAQVSRDPVEVAVTPPSTTVERIQQRVIHVDRERKPRLLEQVLREAGLTCALVFTRTKHGADKVGRALAKAGLDAQVIHGNKSQNQRERALASFREGRARILVATDIAARGIDVAGISHIVNYDLPNVPETYVHRIGRTARAGAEGVAVSFCTGDERPFLRAIEKTIRMTIPASGESNAPPARAQAEPRPSRSAPKGYRRGRPASKAKAERSARPEPKPSHPDRKPQRPPAPDVRSYSAHETGVALAALPFLKPPSSVRRHDAPPPSQEVLETARG